MRFTAALLVTILGRCSLYLELDDPSPSDMSTGEDLEDMGLWDQTADVPNQPDASPEVCDFSPTSLTADTITHFAADRFSGVVFFAARLSTGVIQLGRIDGDSVQNDFATTSIPGTGIHSISVAAVNEDRMVFAVLRDQERLVDLWSCTTDGCMSFGITGLQDIAEMQLASGDPPLLGYVRGNAPNQEFVAQTIDLETNSIVPGHVLRASQLTGIEGVSFAGAENNNFRVAFGSPLSGYCTATGTGMLESERCLTFEKRTADSYFTRVNRLSEYILLGADGLFLTNCSSSLELTTRRPRDADFSMSSNTTLAVWPEPVSGIERVRGALIHNGAIERRLDFGEWSDVSHVRVFRTHAEQLVFFGGPGTHLQLLRSSPEDFAACLATD